MTPKTCAPVLLLFCLTLTVSSSFSQTTENLTFQTASIEPYALSIPLSVEPSFLVLESAMTAAESAMTALLATVGVLSDAALAVTDALMNNAADGISIGTNSTLTTVQRCGRAASSDQQDALNRYSQAVQRCIAEDVDQIRLSYQSLEQSISNATAVAANAVGGAFSCITRGQSLSEIMECIQVTLPQTLANVSEALTRVASSFMRAVVLSIGLPVRTIACRSAASAGTAAAIVAVQDNLGACLATALMQM